MENQIVLITGSTDGIGKASAIEAANRGARVIVHGRSSDRVRAVQREIADIAGNEPLGVTADFSSLQEVRDLARRLAQDLPRLDVLINNAGIISRTRKTSRDGYELTFAVNHLAPFLLTTSLLDLLRHSASARVVTVSSMVHHGARIDFDDLMQEDGYDGMRAYGQSKLANLLFTMELARRESAGGDGDSAASRTVPGTVPRTESRPDGAKRPPTDTRANITAVALHPGVINTKVLHEYFSGGAPVSQGADNVLTPALDPRYADVTGTYFVGGRPETPDPAATDPETARRLWEASAQLCEDA